MGWFLSLALTVFFIGNFVLHTLDFVWLNPGEKVPTDAGGQGKSTAMKVSDGVGYVLLLVSLAMVSFGHHAHKKREHEEQEQREAYVYDYQHGNMGLRLPCPEEKGTRGTGATGSLRLRLSAWEHGVTPPKPRRKGNTRNRSNGKPTSTIISMGTWGYASQAQKKREHEEQEQREAYVYDYQHGNMGLRLPS